MADQDPGGISLLQQMVASGTGAVVTSLFSKTWDGGVGAAGDWGRPEIRNDLALDEGSGRGPERSFQTCPPPPVTPLDVVKVRLQSQRPSVASGECLTLEPIGSGARDPQR